MTFFPILFFLGVVMGSFLNVIAVRYDPDRFLLHSDVIGGRSRCPHCRTQLRWYELIPLVSFLAQGGLCRSCKKRLSIQYPLVELLSGFIFVSVFWQLGHLSFLLASVWAFIFLIFLLIVLIDIRIHIIPNELVVALVILAIPLLFITSSLSLLHTSFIGHYGFLFGFQENIWFNHFLGFLAGGFFFLFLLLVTWGKGVGGGDMKLSAALGLLFGWPDIFFIIPLAFVLGTFFILPLLFSGRAKRKDMIPFGPFLVLSSTLIFFFGFSIIDFYFHLFGI